MLNEIFNEFPVIDYTIRENATQKSTDIFRRVKVRSKMLYLALFDKIDIPEEIIQDIAYNM